MKVRLTDQAVVAVAVAEQTAPAGRPPNLAELLVGIATEPDGVAGAVLRMHASAAGALQGRLATMSPRMPPADVALRWAHDEVGDRPVGTTQLLRAALETGGAELADLLAACGYDMDALRAAIPDARPEHALDEPAGLGETFAFDPTDDTMTLPAARAVARARAAGGAAVHLLVAVALEAELTDQRLPLPGDLAERSARCADSPAPSGWDIGAAAVVEAARRAQPAGMPLGLLDLLRAVALVGGQGPARLLADQEENGDR